MVLWIPEDLVRLASAVVPSGPFPGHLSQTRRPPLASGLLPDGGMGWDGGMTKTDGQEWRFGLAPSSQRRRGFG